MYCFNAKFISLEIPNVKKLIISILDDVTLFYAIFRVEKFGFGRQSRLLEPHIFGINIRRISKKQSISHLKRGRPTYTLIFRMRLLNFLNSTSKT